MIIIISSCYQSQNGCLDPFAQNYDLDGDDSCGECCVYPTLSLAIGHYNGEQEFVKGDTILTAKEPLRLLDFVYTISDVKIIEGDSTIVVRDTTTLDDDSIIIDDLIKVKSSGYINNVGKFRYEGSISNILFNVGLPPILSDRYLINDSHAINNSTDSLYYNSDYYQQRLLISKGQGFKDTLQIDIPISKGQINYDLVLSSSSFRGMAKTVKLRADYAKWFESIDLTESKQTIAERILSNQDTFITVE